ncbi:MAG: CNNM domain-containing protein [Saprospiraceae bacterium]|nr:CNNM domain-containing protein [Saprospiraceae bacterium]
MEILIVAFLVILSACFSGLTLGFFSLNLTSLERKMKLGDERAKKIYPVRKNGNLLLCTLLLGNVAVNSAMSIFLGNIATGLVAGLVSTMLIVVFGEILPQAIFSRFALTLGAKSVWLVKLFIFLLYPIAYPLSYTLDKALGEELATIFSKKEIEEIIRYHEDSEESVIDEDEERILLGALRFSDLTAEMVATPRPVVFMVPSDTVISAEFLATIKDKAFTRIPVFNKKNPEDIQGIIIIRDLLGIDTAANIQANDILRSDFLSIKKEIKLDDLLNHFLANKKHIACLYNEFQTFVGIVTLEDILEEILKTEILDEGDIVKDMRQLAAKLVKKDLLS